MPIGVLPAADVGSAQLRTEGVIADDFTSAQTVGVLGWTVTTSGAGAALITQPPSEVSVQHPGVWELNTGTTATGYTSVYLPGASASAAPFVLSGVTGSNRIIFDAIIKPSQRPSSGGNSFRAYAGFSNSFTAPGAGIPTDGVFFIADPTLPNPVSPTWHVAVGATLIDTGVAIPSSTNWVRVSMVIDSVNATFFIGNPSSSAPAQVAQVLAATLPSGRLGAGFRARKTLATNARSLYVDFVKIGYEFGGGLR